MVRSGKRRSVRPGPIPRCARSRRPRWTRTWSTRTCTPQTAEIEARCVHMLADLWNDRNAQYLAGEIAKLGPFEVIYAGDGNGILALCWRLTEGVDHDFTLFDLADRLRKTGWQVPAYTLPAHREDLAIQR